MLYGESYCPSCGQALVSIVAARNAPPPATRVVTPVNKPRVMLTIFSILAVCFIASLSLRALWDERDSKPPLPCGQLVLGMTELEALRLMGQPFSREFRRPDHLGGPSVVLEWPDDLGRQWKGSCYASFEFGRLYFATYTSVDGPGFTMMKEEHGGEWKADTPR